MLESGRFGHVLEEDGVVGHAGYALVRESGLEHARTGLGVVTFKEAPSVSCDIGGRRATNGVREEMTHTFDRDVERLAVVVQGVEVLLVEFGSQERVAVHAFAQRGQVVEVLLVNRLGRFAELEVLVLRRESHLTSASIRPCGLSPGA